MLLLVVGLIVAGLQTLPTLNDAPTPNPRSGATASPGPTDQPTATPVVRAADSTLMDNPIYRLR